MAGLLWYRSYMDSLANTSGYYPDIHAGHADRVTELTPDAPYLVRETPAGYNQLKLMELVGGSVAWNQQFGYLGGNIASQDVTYTRSLDGYSGTINGTATVNGNVAFDRQNIIANHVYYGSIGGSLPTNAKFTLGGLSFTGVAGGLLKYGNNVNQIYCRIEFVTGVTFDNVAIHPQLTDLTQMFGSTIADYVYSLEQATAGSGIAWLKSYGFFTEDYYAYSAPTLQSVEATSHVTKDANNTTIATYPLDSDLVLRGIPKLSNGNLYYDGDTYEWDGTVNRRFDIVDLGTLEWTLDATYQVFLSQYITTKAQNSNYTCAKYLAVAKSRNNLNEGEIGTYNTGNAQNRMAVKDSNYTTAAAFKTAMSGVYLIYELATQTTESADPFTAVQTVEDGGTEEFVTTNGVPVGNVSIYRRA